MPDRYHVPHCHARVAVEGIANNVFDHWAPFRTLAADGDLSDCEADTYWCLSMLLDELHDNYTAGQPGIQKAVFRTRELCRRIDSALFQVRRPEAGQHANHAGCCVPPSR